MRPLQFHPTLQKQIPFGNDRKKGNCEYRGRSNCKSTEEIYRSIAMATELPPPRHSAATPRRARRRIIS